MLPQASLFLLSGLIAALAVFVWKARPDNSINRWFGAYTLLMAFWILGIGGLHGDAHLEAWGRVTFAAGSLMPATFLAFTRCYPTMSIWPSGRLLSAAFAAGGIFAALSLTTPLVINNVTHTNTGFSRQTGPLYAAFSVYFLVGWLAALCVFVAKWRRASGIARAQLHYLGAGLVLPVAGGITTNLVLPLVTGKSTYSWLGPYFSVPLVAIVGHAIIRHRLMDLRVFIHRSFAHLVAISAVGLTIVMFTKMFVADLSTELIRTDWTIIAFSALLMLTAPMNRIIRRFVDPYLFRGWVDYDAALRDATQRLSRLMQPIQLAAELKEILSTTFVPESFAMAACPLEGGPLEVVLAHDIVPTHLLEQVHLVADERRPMLVNINPSNQRGVRQGAHEGLARAGVELLIVLARREQLLGVVFIGRRRSGDPFFVKDLVFLESLAQLVSIALENSLLYRHRLQMLEYSDRLLESLSSAVVAVDLNGAITSFNPAAQALLCLQHTRPGESFSALPSEVAWGLCFALTEAWLPREVEITIDHEIRGPLPAILSIAVLHDQNQSISGALAIVTDLSTVKALERNQRRMEHLALMARFYAGIAHEIRSPLAAISNFISMLPDRFNDPEYRDTAARLLPIEVGRIVRLADRLRLMAPSEDGKLSHIDLQPLLTDIVAIHSPSAKEQRISMTLHCSEGLPQIMGDPSQLVQLFVNLIRNAIEAMPSGGTITIEAQHQEARGGRSAIVVRVIDDGVGIDAAVRSKIFEPFFTTKLSGTGLGLSICREISDFHRARLLIMPRLHVQGTIAQVEFPTTITSLDEESRLHSHSTRSLR